MTNTLAKIQAEVRAPKGQFNNFGKYKYRSCEDIVEAVKPVINPLGFSLTLSDQVVFIGNRFYVEATATISNGQESFSVKAFAREEEVKKGMDSAQITGAASSYARKYALNGLFAIDDTKDADFTNVTGELATGKTNGHDVEIIFTWETELKNCKTKSDLVALYNGNKATVDGSPEIKQLFKNAEKQLK